MEAGGSFTQYTSDSIRFRISPLWRIIRKHLANNLFQSICQVGHQSFVSVDQQHVYLGFRFITIKLIEFQKYNGQISNCFTNFLLRSARIHLLLTYIKQACTNCVVVVQASTALYVDSCKPGNSISYYESFV